MIAVNENPAPQAATELFTESYRLSPKQREVLTVLQGFPEGARAIEVAKALDMHVNTARGHLEELVAQDAVRVVTAPAKGRGRPSLIFQTRVPDNRAVAQEYITLIELMASLLGASDEDVFQDPALHAKAKAVGAQWAAIMGSNASGWETLETAMAPMLARLRAMGFDPTTENAQPTEDPEPAVPPADTSGDVSIHLNSCPFIVDGKRPSSFVCAVHEGFIEESLRTPDKIFLELKPFNAPGTCEVRVTQER
ncbi:hypothetical protein HMPREF0290_0661 [Corynebacterium efficiens YS-314]|uniref:Uncharacterized protein n=1 Tax=Corynebacterium efficiens (strain DSM 44549 / YS-314 / AJ 12310 / JCM 11189 / NBRC 100395) TaxID=196164 RepID=Q8FQ43_COREF|nr:transcriptional regulator [Corynebacterium efficiens]EEW50697.1 hypothetical protein HMPREF0290_0661 [Corynebacterium efficiens YS-314]BAC18102.1 hypothetical protein [Corynebacterium efficiens YS-314]